MLIKNASEQDCFRSDGQYRTADYLDRILTPKICRCYPMQYSGSYLWYGQWSGGFRKVIRLFLLKGDSAILEWGYNFDFLPEIKSGAIRYFRTDKSVTIQLREFPKPFIDFGQWDSYKIPMHAADCGRLAHKLEEVWELTRPDINAWFDRVSSLETMIEETESQMESQKYYRILLPEHRYMKAFLLARLGEKALGRTSLEQSRTYQEAGQKNQNRLMKILEETG